MAIVVAVGALVTAAALFRGARHPSGPWTPAAIPKIDVHTHLAPSTAPSILPALGEQGIRVVLNASGGVPGQGFEQSIDLARQTGGAVRPYCNFPLTRVNGPDFASFVRALLGECKRLGAVGLKIPKSLGLGVLTEGPTPGSRVLLRIDDPRLDVLFETAGELGLPVLIHSGDPKAFFQPDGPQNERHDELAAHPDWSFFGEMPEGLGRWPGWQEIFDQFVRRVGRHPQTTFVGAHFGNDPEDPEFVARLLDEHPNLVVETAARVPEIGRFNPTRMRAIFERHQDRLLFGSDLGFGPGGLTLGSSGAEPDTLDRLPFFFRAHWRYFETNDQHFAHPTPIQGRWTIDGIGLEREILEKVYWRNAARVFGIVLPR